MNEVDLQNIDRCLTRVNAKTHDKENSVDDFKELCKGLKYDTSDQTKHVELNSIGIQCSKSDEEILTSNKSSSDYWHSMILKRKTALADTIAENSRLHDCIDLMSHENESLREECKELLEMVDELNLIKVSQIDWSTSFSFKSP
jgi:hypothetical protein